jgi:hypothetical protein
MAETIACISSAAMPAFSSAVTLRIPLRRFMEAVLTPGRALIFSSIFAAHPAQSSPLRKKSVLI